MTVEPAVKVKVVLPLELRVAGEKAAVTPVGKPLTAKEAAELSAFCVLETTRDSELLVGSVSELTLVVIASEGTATVSVTVTVCLSDPLVPAIVKVYEPAVALDAAVNLSALTALPVILAGVKVALTLVGKPETESATAELNPFTGVANTFTEVELPVTTSKLVKDGVTAKLGAAMISETFTVCFRDPLVPVMVIVEELPTALEATVSFNALIVVPLMLVGVKVAVTPLDNPETASATAELKPFCGVIVRLSKPELPGAMEREVKLGVTAKVGAVTTTAMLRVAVWPPPLPVTVRL